jgi:thiol-disulfide isomerase/thioredoxin
LVLCLATGVGLVAAFAEDDAPVDLADAPRPENAESLGVGRHVGDLAFVDLGGQAGALSGYADRKALVIAYTNTDCPVCRKYGPRLAELERRFTARNVAFLFVNPSAEEDPARIREQIQAWGFKGRYVHDVDATLTGPLGARTTGEVFVLDAARTLVYRGAVDDQHGVGWSRDAPRVHLLVDALERVLAGQRPDPAATSAPGCLLGGAPTASASPAITWHEDISRIVQHRCLTCHREGENGPFELRHYSQVKAKAAMIRWVVEEKRMPPWFAGPGSLPMKNDHDLTTRERGELLAWIDAGCPEGDPRSAPLPRTFIEGWKIGTPDVVYRLPSEQRIPATGTVRYRYLEVESRLSEDRWVQAFEVRPTAPQVVHHVLVFCEYPKDHERYRDRPRDQQGLRGYFAAMVPGQGHVRYPEGLAKFMPRGARLRFQLHYTTNGTAATDRTEVGLIFAKQKPAHEVRSAAVSTVRFRIPPGASNHRVSATRMLPLDATLLGFTPHMHLRGKSYRYDLLLPDGTQKLLLDVPRYDFNWQLYYALREPLAVPAGSRIKGTAHYDNSEGNPANPDPTAAVRHGEQTWDEMMIGYVDWYPTR